MAIERFVMPVLGRKPQRLALIEARVAGRGPKSWLSPQSLSPAAADAHPIADRGACGDVVLQYPVPSLVRCIPNAVQQA